MNDPFDRFLDDEPGGPMARSYNGWEASKDPHAIGINPDWAPLGHRFPGGCKAGDVETIFTYFVTQLDARVEPIDRDAVKDEWGYSYKQSANSSALISCHSSGTAFDYNATRHPNGHRGTWTAKQVAEIRKIQAECSDVVRWLGDAARVPDEMHFEIFGTPGEVATAATRLRDNQEDDFMDPTQYAEFIALLKQQHGEVIQVIREQTDGLATSNGRHIDALPTGIAKAVKG